MLLITVVAAIAIIGLVAVVIVLLRELERQRTELLITHQRSDESQAAERRELASRIQQPERVPIVPMPEFMFPEQEDDEIGLVGAIVDTDPADGDE